MTETTVLKVEDIRKEAEDKKCPVQKALFYIEGFLEGPMCGRCFPCALGSYEAKIRLQNLIEDRGSEEDIEVLRRIADDMLISSFCKKGKDTARFMLEWIDSGVFQEHVVGTCRDMECKDFVEYRIIPEKCIMCGECKDVCKAKAIFGKRKKKYQSGGFPFEIRQKRCEKRGDCIKVCPTGAIVFVSKHETETVEI
jgi:ferredoxin